MCLRRRDNWKQLLDDEERGGTLVPIFMLAHQHDSDPELRPPPNIQKAAKQNPDSSCCRVTRHL